MVEPQKSIPVLQVSQPRTDPTWDVSPTLLARMGTGGNQVPVLLGTIQNATRGKSQNGLGISQDDVSYTLDSLGNHAVCIQGSMIGRADKKWAAG